MICLETGLRSVAMYTCVLRTFRMEFPCFLWTKAFGAMCFLHSNIRYERNGLYCLKGITRYVTI